MTYDDLVRDVAANAGISNQETKRVLEVFIGSVTRKLQKGEVVSLNTLGKLSVRHHKERGGRNPQTGEPIIIPARKSVFLKVSKNLTDVL